MVELDYNDTSTVHPLHISLNPPVVIKIKPISTQTALIWIEDKVTGEKVAPERANVTLQEIPPILGNRPQEPINRLGDHFVIDRDQGYHLAISGHTILTLTPQRKQVMTVHPLVSFRYDPFYSLYPVLPCVKNADGTVQVKSAIETPNPSEVTLVTLKTPSTQTVSSV